MNRDALLKRLRALAWEIEGVSWLFLAPGAVCYIYAATTVIVFGSLLWFGAVWPILPLFFIVNSWLIYLNYKAEIRGILARAVHPATWKTLTPQDSDRILKELAKSKPGPA